MEQSGARAVRQPNLPDTNLSLSHRLALAAGEQEEEETKLRPDLLVQGRLPETECMIDVAVVHPSSPSYVKNDGQGWASCGRGGLVGAGRNTWMTTPPKDESTTLGNGEFKHAMRFKLGLVPYAKFPLANPATSATFE